VSFQDIVKLIESKTGLSREEILKKIDEKLESFKDLITPEGAAYLVAKDLGVELPRKERKIKIQDILPGVKHISFLGRVFAISPIREFETGGRKGRVCNLYIADETGFVRLPLWNDQVDWLENSRLSVGQIVQIVNAVSRENIYGETEISLGRFGLIRIAEDTGELPPLEVLQEKYSRFTYEPVRIAEIERSGRYEVKGFVVAVFKSDFIFEDDKEKYLLVPTVIDDSTATLRVTFFREQAEKLLGSTVEEVEKMSAEERRNFVEDKILGLELVVRGRVKHNKQFDRLEMIANDFEHLNPLEESKKLLGELIHA